MQYYRQRTTEKYEYENGQAESHQWKSLWNLRALYSS